MASKKYDVDIYIHGASDVELATVRNNVLKALETTTDVSFTISEMAADEDEGPASGV